MAKIDAFRALRPSGDVLVFPGGDAWAAVAHWKRAGLLREDGDPAAYIAQCPSNPPQQGVRFLVCAAEVDDSLMPLEELSAADEHSSPMPVAALAPDDHGVLRELLRQSAADGAPGRVALTRVEGARAWRALRDYLSDVPVRTLGPLPPRGARCLLAVAPLNDPGLTFRPFHRGLRGLDTFQVERFLTLVSAHARVHALEEPLTSERGVAAAWSRLAALTGVHHAVLLVLPGGEGRILRFRQWRDEAMLRAAPRNPTLRSLDLALLESVVLHTVLGIHQLQRPDHPNVVVRETLEKLIADVCNGVLQAGFALKAPPVWELRAVIEAAAALPPRTLAVEPALPSGMILMAS